MDSTIEQELNRFSMILADYIANICLHAPTTPMLGKKPGDRYGKQYYMAPLLFNPVGITSVGKLLIRRTLDTIESSPINLCLVGAEWTSYPLITSMQLLAMESAEREISASVIRSERKSYGKHNLFEGLPFEDMHTEDGSMVKPTVVIVDAIANSTNGYKRAHDLCVKEGYNVAPFVLAILNKYGPSQGPEWEYDKYLKTHRIVSLVNGDDVNNALRSKEAGVSNT